MRIKCWNLGFNVCGSKTCIVALQPPSLVNGVD
jgi:hypothetical protein